MILLTVKADFEEDIHTLPQVRSKPHGQNDIAYEISGHSCDSKFHIFIRRESPIRYRYLLEIRGLSVLEDSRHSTGRVKRMNIKFKWMKIENESQGTFLGNKSRIFSCNYNFAHFPEKGLFGGSSTLENAKTD